MVKKLKILFAETVLILLAVCGCFDNTETEDRKYVVLMGLDGTEKAEGLSDDKILIGEGGQYILSAGEAELESDIEKSTEKQKTILVRGNTIPEMRRTADMYSSKKMYFGQLKAVVLGEDIYSQTERLTDIVYAMERMEDINTKIVVFASDTALESVDAVMAKGSKGGLYLWDYYKNNGGETDLNEYMNFEYLIKSMRQDETFIIPKISVDNEEVFLDGGVVISADQFKGEITSEDIRSAKWLKGTAEGELITIGNISAKVKSQEVNISEDNSSLKIEIEASIAIESGYDVNKDEAEKEFEMSIQRSLTDTINKSVDLEADFLQLTPDGKLNGLNFVVEADIQIISAGVIK